MGTQKFYDELSHMSLESLQAELDYELQELQELRSSPPYEDQGRQINETRDNIRMVKMYIAQKSGGA